MNLVDMILYASTGTLGAFITYVFDIEDWLGPVGSLLDSMGIDLTKVFAFGGAKATIEKLSLPYAYTFLTTHDLELGQLKKQNYHFEEYYQDAHIYFDYKIKLGVSKSSNGQFLLKQVGILDE